MAYSKPCQKDALCLLQRTGTGERQAPRCGVTCSSPGAHWDMIQIVLKTGSAHLTSTCKTHAKRRVFHQCFCQPLGGASLWESLRIGTKTYSCQSNAVSHLSSEVELGAGKAVFQNCCVPVVKSEDLMTVTQIQ